MKERYLILFLLLSLFSVAQDKGVLISGKVSCDRGNYGVENALVHLTLSGGYTFSYKTDSSGTYRFAFGIHTPSSCTLSVSINKDSKSMLVRDGCFIKSKETGIISELHDSTSYVKDFLLHAAFCEYEQSPVLFYTNSISSCNDSLYQTDSIGYQRFDSVLNELYELLKTNPTIRLEFTGHASMLEHKQAEALALYRAQLMRKLMIAKGIDGKRLSAKGFGNRKLLINDVQIKKIKTPEEKLKLHLKNQRVVFRIVNWDTVKISEEEVPEIDGK